MEETQKEKQAVPEPIDIITLLHDVLRGVKKLWWACLLLTVLCAAGSWYTAKRAYRPLYRAAASFTVATGSGESGGFSYGFYYNTATASQLARTFPYTYPELPLNWPPLKSPLILRNSRDGVSCLASIQSYSMA